jgi:predicted Fe-S protein YdhL (DUF1289 family)
MSVARRRAPTYVLHAANASVPLSSLRASRPMQSPCVHVCAIDPSTGLCAGCGRTLDEIARWAEMTEDERERIISALSNGQRRALRAAGR